MSRTLYRSIAIQVQNSSAELLSVEAADLGPGEWLGAPPARGEAIPPHSHGGWRVASTRLALGIEGWVRMACTRGYFRLSWRMEWVGPLLLDHLTPDTDAITITTTCSDEEPPHPACLFTVAVAARPLVRLQVPT